MNIYLNHFPKFEKYALTQEIRQCMYEVYAFMVEAQKRYHKKTALTNLDVRHEQWRMFVSLAYALGYFDFNDGKEVDATKMAPAAHRFLAINRLIDELGRMFGAWMGVERQKEQQREAP